MYQIKKLIISKEKCSYKSQQHICARNNYHSI